MRELLNAILAELQLMNQHNRDIDRRLNALENKDRFLIMKEAKDYLGISYHTLANRTRKGLLTPCVVGGRKGYMLSELNKYQPLNNQNND